MKKFSKMDQRKLYKMFVQVLDSKVDYQIHAEYGYGRTPDLREIRAQKEAKKEEFLSLLEEGIEEQEA